MKVALSLACILVTGAAASAALAQSTHQELKPVAFASLDANKDGKISAREAHADPDLEADFEMLDLNHDGFLTPTEFKAWPRAMKTNDKSVDPTTVPGGSSNAQHMPAN